MWNLTIYHNDQTVEQKIFQQKPTLTDLQEIVGGFIETVHLPNEMYLVFDEEGKMRKKKRNEKATGLLPFNYQLVGDFVAGTAFLCHKKILN